MNVYFLKAEKPIRKKYERNTDGTLVKHSYPNVYEVTSTEVSISRIEDLASAITSHAANGETLVKGALSRNLVLESRAGSTDADQKTEWICLDLDGILNYQSVDLFLQSIGLHDVDYVLQWSSSMGIENNAGFRCHVFMFLDQPAHPAMLKNWLAHLNLTTPTIAQQLELTKTASALKWPLDITTCQNDKLLYIAPPELGPGVTDPYPNAAAPRISLQKRTHRAATLPYPIASKDAIRQLTDDKINELRKAAKLPKRRATSYKYTAGVEYIANPDTAIVTETRTERGFVYLNLNGGDSWAYYHPENNPTYIHNFKGEPSYRTEDLLPEYYAKVQAAAPTVAISTTGTTYLAFRDFRSSVYYNGHYDAGRNELVLAQAKSETQLRHFMEQHGQSLGKFIPDWNIIFDPQSTTVVDTVQQTINTYKPSRYMAVRIPPRPRSMFLPPTIGKVMAHAVGNDGIALGRFLNWLACIVQYRDKCGTAWILHGVEGTGKGLLFHNVLTPILGMDNTTMKRMEELESDFNGYMENNLLVFIDEMETGRSLYHSKIASKLKNFITEPYVSIRRMYQAAFDARSYVNMVFVSNKGGAVHVPPEDRRFNVATFQTEKLSITGIEVAQLASELDDFYAFLMHYKADRDLARTPLINDARDKIINISTPALDGVLTAVRAGDLEFLWDQLPDKNTRMAMSPDHGYRYDAYHAVIMSLLNTQPQNLSRDELYAITNWCVGDMPESPHKFASLLKHHKTELETVWKNGRTCRGIKISQWKAPTAFLTAAQAAISAGLV